MSSQKGNVSRSRCQKHKNRTAFKNDLHDTSHQTKMINALDVHGVCLTCKGVIEWKIKYKKYKPLTVPKKCTKCDNKTVVFAYHTICKSCAKSKGICAKCGETDKPLVSPKPTAVEATQLETEYQQKLKLLSERQRRTLTRKCKEDPEQLPTMMNNIKEKDLNLSDFDDDEDFESDISD